MLRKLALAALFITLGAVTAMAADINGKWEAAIETPRGTQNVTFDFHVDGATVTGKVTSPRGETDIQDGKLDGSTLTFVQVITFNGNEMKAAYTGTVDGDTIKFSRSVADRPAIEFTATRAK